MVELSERWLEGIDLEFTLVYEGELKAHNEARDKSAHKHAIRKQFHPQLRNLWKMKLSHWMNSTQVSRLKVRFVAGDSVVKQIARNYSICGYKFVPLVRADLMLACKLDIVFLRRESGQGRIIQGGDIDNRLKTLFDALRAPKDCKEIGEAPVEADEDPFFCLLEDDSLITEISVRTDTLLTQETTENENDVKLMIKITLRPLQLTESNSDFA